MSYQPPPDPPRPPPGGYPPQHPPPHQPPPQHQQPQYRPLRDIGYNSAQPPRKRKLSTMQTIGMILIVAVTSVLLVSYFTETQPTTGECLASMDERFFGGLEVVACSSSQARYEVVAESGNTDPCADHPEGSEFVERARRSHVDWAICVVEK